LNEIKVKNDLIDDFLRNNLDDSIILNAFKSKYTEEELPYKTEILKVEDLIDRNEFKLAVEQLKPLMKLMPKSPRCLYSSAYLIDKIAEREKNNIKLYQCIEIYKKLFTTGELHKSLLYVAGRRLVNRLQFIGRLKEAISYGEYINKMISSNLNIINDLAISYLMANKLKQAKEKFEQVLTLDNNNTVAICHYAVILKTFDNRLEESVIYFKTCLNTRETVALDARFFYHLGDSLQRLNRTDEVYFRIYFLIKYKFYFANKKAYHYYEIGVEYGFFNSVHQRSLFNEPFLRAKPIWNLTETGYQDYFKVFELNY
jgi:aspartate beta-hydroxylase